MCQYANVPIGCAVYRMALAYWHIGKLANYSKLSNKEHICSIYSTFVN